MKTVGWQYFKDPNEINKAMREKDPEWDDLKDADQIINIIFDPHHGCYVVFWKEEI